MSEKSASPIALDIVDIELHKFTGEKMSLIPQFMEFVLYQSIFQSIIRAELTLVDPIGLFYKFPLVGEELLTIKYKPTRNYPTSGDEIVTSNQVLEWKFFVNSAKAINPDDRAQIQTYKLELFSIEILANARTRVQKAFKDTYSNVAKKIIKDDLGADTKKINDALIENSKGMFQFIVPNMKPLETLSWLAKRAVGDNRFMFLFWENFDGYNFRTLEGTIEKGMTGIIPEFYYVSNQDKLSSDQLDGAGIKKHQIITAMQTQRRFNTMEKSLFGYFENEYYDVDVFNKRITSTRHKLKPVGDPDLKKYNMNQDAFLTRIQTTTETPGISPRTHLRISNDKGDYPGAPQFWEDKFGPVTKMHTALKQISITIAVPGDTNLNAGAIIDLKIPEVYGFTTKQEDRYLAGKYIVVSLKHLVTVAERHVTVLELHRANFEQMIQTTSDFYQGEEI